MFGRKQRQKTVERVVEESYWNGFFACLARGSKIDPFEYSSTSGLYTYNECRKIAFAAGYEFCEQVLHERETATTPNWFGINRSIPGEVYAAAYGAARIAA